MRTILCLLVAASVFLGYSAAVAEDLKEVPSPDLQVGDEWTYETVDTWNRTPPVLEQHAVTDLLESRVRLHITIGNPGDASTVRRPLMDVRTLTIRIPSRSGPFTYLAFPLSIGKEWESVYSRPSPNAANIQLETSRWSKVEKWEDVTVPAGTFRSLRVTVKERTMVPAMDGIFPAYTYQTIWYSPDVRQTLKIETEARNVQSKRIAHHVRQLVKFKIADTNFKPAQTTPAEPAHQAMPTR